MDQRSQWLGRRIGRLPPGWWAALLCLPALVPLTWGPFFESHDGLFHVYRLIALDKAVRSGVLYPRWFPTFAYGYGHPVLNFYGPLSYYWGLPFTLLGLNAALAMKLVLASGLIASALGMFLFARLHFDRVPALVASVVYAYLPYHLLDLYLRGAVAEYLSFVWFPLILWSFHRLIEHRDGRWFERMVVAASLMVALVLTHSLSAFIFAPLLCGYLLVLIWRQRSRRLGQHLSRLGFTALVGLAIGAFYWLPVVAESRYVGLAHGSSQGYQVHLLPLDELVSWNPAYPYTVEPGQPITFPIGWLQIAILGLALILAFRPGRRRAFSLFFLLAAWLSVWMLTRLSLPAWLSLEKGLAFLQYPWRFEAITALASAFLVAALLQAVPRTLGRAGPGMAGLLLVGLGLSSLWHLPVKPISPDLSTEGMWRLDRELGQIGATWTGEYLPIWVKEERWSISHSPHELPDRPKPEPVAGIQFPAEALRLTGVGHTRYDLSLDATVETTVVLHQFHYPGWQAEWQGMTIPSRPEGDLGLAAYDLPPGKGPLVLRLTLTPVQRWATLLSLSSCLLIGIVLVGRYQLVVPARPFRPLLVATGPLLLGSLLLAALALPNGYVRATAAVNANLENAAQLLTLTLDRTTVRAGEQMTITLYWLALAGMEQDYGTSIHLTDADVTPQPTQHDDDPGWEFTPTTRWIPGELVPDLHYLTLPADLAPGRYRLWANMYEYPAVRSLVVLSSEAPTDGSRVLLSDIQVVAP